ncbi:hypothetical protein THMIRHAS_09040 [Thiosulfatimonas sediminis]|uniref:Flagellar hook-associated protein 2 n=1 Tax=Thiosulfatimonas sediminis TaxID=2675054 RepID=A0A6F8PTS6_9GAMM|nr:flagellar filament capping protein FliD [Thiosulfatimonas sediminis]BBP45531.1 hypothetical protein THMIRHAS_09040 [Thiosulfatimonas sediminis]
MVNEVGSTLLNSLTNSTFDIGNMSKVLAEAEVAGPKAILERNREKTNTELNALTYLQTNINAFKTYLQDLSNPETFTNATVSSSNENVFSASLTGTAVNGSYQIETRQIAQAHSQVANKVYASAGDSLSMGSLQISVGGKSYDPITVDASNNTLEGLQRTINNGDYGVNASIINTGNGYQLMFTSKNTGAASEMSISGIADFDNQGFTTTSTAQDAMIAVNGLAITSASNTFEEVIPGLSLNVKSAQPGTVNTLEVTQDKAGVIEKVEAFVDVFNQLDTILDELGSYEKLTDEQKESDQFAFWGDLAGSSVLKQVRRDLESSFSGAINEINSDYNSLAVIGLSINRDGEMQLDREKLDSIADLGLDKLQGLFAKGGSSDDPLVNVLAGNDKTQTGEYSLNITQLAERATVPGGAVVDTTDQQVAGARVLNPEAALTVTSGASFTLNGNPTPITFSAQTYATREDLLAGMQADIDAQAGAGLYALNYDSAQARFELTAANGVGAVELTNVTNLGNQGFTQTQYTGENLLTIGAGSMDYSIDQTSGSLSIAAGRYTLSEMADSIRLGINNNPDLQAAGAAISVNTDGGVLNISSARYGGNSKVELSNFSGLTNIGFADGAPALSDLGQSVDGTLTTATGTLNIGAYASLDDGRKVKISDFAFIGSDPAEVRGLEFEVLGGTTPRTSNLNFAQGFASRMEEAINNLFEDDQGLITQRLESLNNKNSDFDSKQEKIDARYDKLLMKYQLQFSALQSLLSSSEQTRNMLSATFNSNNNN